MADYRLLIFDWDGTLVDSIGRIVASVHRAAELCGLERCDDDRVKGIIGLALPEAIRTLYPMPQQSAHLEAFLEHYSATYLSLDQQPSAFFPGVEQGLQALREQGYQLAVATGKSRCGLQRILQALGCEQFFDITRCADETASKPDPLMLHEILQYCGVTAKQALMIGDSTFDLLMAQRAGMDAVAVGYGAQPLAVLSEYKPTLAVGHFNELATWLSQQAAQRKIEVSDDVG